jgi:hypothetical protein
MSAALIAFFHLLARWRRQPSQAPSTDFQSVGATYEDD